MSEQLKRCVVVCSVVLQSGHVGDVVLVGCILCLYYCNNGDFCLCVVVLMFLFFLGRVCSSLLMSDVIWLMILLGVFVVDV